MFSVVRAYSVWAGRLISLDTVFANILDQSPKEARTVGSRAESEWREEVTRTVLQRRVPKFVSFAAPSRTQSANECRLVSQLMPRLHDQNTPRLRYAGHASAPRLPLPLGSLLVKLISS